MPWWAWVAVGGMLLGAELSFVDAQFYLIFVGGAALIVGFLEVAGLHVADWLQWAIFGLLSATSVLGFRARIYERMRGRLPPVKTNPHGDTLIMPATLPPGESCRCEYRGSSWTARNAGPVVISAGSRARIERVDGLTLVVHADL
ncbi:MAG TPA: NfeD family protein [Steroidobacteraceae bacterium]|nr:NfeD family protein [Steroidobacteraceae bacterium]